MGFRTLVASFFSFLIVSLERRRKARHVPEENALFSDAGLALRDGRYNEVAGSVSSFPPTKKVNGVIRSQTGVVVGVSISIATPVFLY